MNSVHFYKNKKFWEQFCNSCYEVGINPLPILRKLYPNIPFGYSCVSYHDSNSWYDRMVIYYHPNKKFYVWM